jgi:hypothetical protein
MGRPQVVDKCFNSTPVDIADLGITLAGYERYGGGMNTSEVW